MAHYKQLIAVGVTLTIMGVLVGCATENRSTVNDTTLNSSSGSTNPATSNSVTSTQSSKDSFADVTTAQAQNSPNQTQSSANQTPSSTNQTPSSTNQTQSLTNQTQSLTNQTQSPTNQADSSVMIEKGATIKLQKQANLFNDGRNETIALVNLPLVPGENYSGYLGIWDTTGQLLQKFPLNGYDIMFPVAIYASDLSQDEQPDIVLETDEHANGGNGVHHVYVYIQNNHHFVAAPLPDSPVTKLSVSYQRKTKNFLIQSQEDLSRSWSASLNANVMNFLHKNLLNGKQAVHIDPVSSISVANGSLTTKRWLWFGGLQLNNLGMLATDYQYTNGAWSVVEYNVESTDSAEVSQ